MLLGDIVTLVLLDNGPLILKKLEQQSKENENGKKTICCKCIASWIVVRFCFMDCDGFVFDV